MPIRWSGPYTIGRQRGGLIDFELTPGKGEALGDVLMIPRGAERAYGVRPRLARAEPAPTWRPKC